MNIIACHGFGNNTKSAVILTCSSKLVDNYLSKVFVIIEKFKRLEQWDATCEIKINLEHIYIYINTFVMACYREISFEANTLKIFKICSGLYI